MPLSLLKIIICLGEKEMCKQWTLQVRIYLNTKLCDTNIKCYKHINKGPKRGLVHSSKSNGVGETSFTAQNFWVIFIRIKEILLKNIIRIEEI